MESSSPQSRIPPLLPWWKPRHRTGRRAALVLAMLLAAFGVFLLVTGSDWRDAMALREEAGKSIRVHDYVLSGLWWAALGNLGFTVLLLLSVRWWAFESRKDHFSPPPVGRAWWVAVLLILLAGLVMRWPRMDFSYYNDEAAAFARFTAGQFEPASLANPEGTPEFRLHTWEEALWRNHTAANHTIFTLLSRICYDVEVIMAGGEMGEVFEVSTRLPALAGGLVSLLGLALLFRELGAGRAGLLAALFLAVHPWHLRYSTEARGYGLVMGFMALSFWCLAAALQRRQWRWWIGYAACQAGFVLTYTGTVYHAATVNGVALAVILITQWRRRRRGESPEWADLSGLLIANVFSAMVYFQVFGPCVPQLVKALQGDNILSAGLPAGWIPDVASFLLLGMPWFDGAPGSPLNPASSKTLVLTLAGGAAVALLLVAGVRGWAARGRTGWILLIGGFLAPALAYAVSAVTDALLLKWYVCYTVVIVAATFGVGLDTLMRTVEVRGSEAAQSLARLVMAAVFVVYLAGIYPAIRGYSATGKQLSREAVLLTRSSMFPYRDVEDPEPVTAGLGHNADVYDPRMVVPRSLDELRTAMAVARERQRPLFFILGGLELARAEEPDLVDELENPDVFEKIATLPALEEAQFELHVYEMRP